MTEIVDVKINGEFQIKLPKHRADRPEWYTEKGWEKKRLQSMHKNLNKGDFILYVGSEEGEMPALCQMWGAEVIMFEPNDKVWPNTKAIWDANKLEAPRGCFVGFAANQTTEGIRLHNLQFPECANGEVIHDHGFKELSDPGLIPTLKLDDVAEFYANVGKLVTAISLDVEGSEWEVLQGAEQTLKRLKPKVWLSLHPEFLFDKYKKYSYEVRRWLTDMGYTEELLAYDHEAHFYYHI